MRLVFYVYKKSHVRPIKCCHMYIFATSKRMEGVAVMKSPRKVLVTWWGFFDDPPLPRRGPPTSRRPSGGQVGMESSARGGVHRGGGSHTGVGQGGPLDTRGSHSNCQPCRDCYLCPMRCNSVPSSTTVETAPTSHVSR